MIHLEAWYREALDARGLEDLRQRFLRGDDVAGLAYFRGVLRSGEEGDKSLIPLFERIANQTLDPHILRWLWENERYPQLSWEAVLATPKESLPKFSYRFLYIDQYEDGTVEEESPDMDWTQGDLRSFLQDFGGMRGFRWNREEDRFTTPWEDVDPEGDDEEDVRFYVRTRSAVEVGDSLAQKWIRDRWPPPEGLDVE